MNLTPREKDKLLVAMAAAVARRRLERGVKLNHPEAVALITAPGGGGGSGHHSSGRKSIPFPWRRLQGRQGKWMRPMSAVTLPSETVPGQQSERPRPRLQRGDGTVEMTFSAVTGVSRLKHLYQKVPCRALFPEPPTDDLATAVIATTSGGITGGDRLRINLSVQEGAAAVATTQAAEKVYRSLGDDCRVDIRVTGDGGHRPYPLGR